MVDGNMAGVTDVQTTSDMGQLCDSWGVLQYMMQL